MDINKLVEIRQRANNFSKAWKKDKDITTHPESVRFASPAKNESGEWITGLTELEAEEMGKKLRKDLSPLSDYWKDLNILLVNRMELVTFNLSITEQLIQYKCAIANKFIAENKERLDDPDYYIRGCFLYVFDPKGDVERENLVQEIRDDITVLISKMKSNKMNMLCVCAKLNISFNENYSLGEFWKMLRSYADKQKTLQHLEALKEVLETPNQQLYVEYIVTKSMIKGGVIKFVSPQWTYGGKTLGNTKQKVISFFEKNEDMFALLIEDNTTE